jgi:hypothetical protein
VAHVEHPDAPSHGLVFGDLDRSPAHSREQGFSRAILKSIKPNIIVVDSFPTRSLVATALEKDIPTVLSLRSAGALSLRKTAT